ncbi:beta-galactosidase [Jiangella aurantiaca]|uniref:Beta-galactosidase n=1 Tax=Jiangella aurantiaca TaxID=2530373 RepID=A0A4R5AIK9_9ACTN|nr:beta-galactosidase [Jiangella aurantiaca]TDD72588.1 beta-galactosidase [Jiangella aurantiaca]
MYYGGDYNPEQWPSELWPRDAELMRAAGVNLVSLGMFSWSRIQPAEGEFDFGWLDEVIGILHAHGVAVNLATATASPPPWATHRYPEMLPQLADGTVLWPGSRQHYAVTSPVYRRLALELVTTIAGRYAGHPAVVMWHVNNEYGCHVPYDYSDNARDAFQGWLHRRYGDIGTLNTAWGTDFWSQRYTSFEQVLPPRSAPYSQNPAALLDFRRFTSDATLELLVMEREAIAASGATQPVTTNFMGPFPALDYWRWADELDLIADDSYPDPADPESFRRAAFTRDLMRSLGGGKPWVLMEQATNAVNWRPANAPKAPGQMAALSMQAVARGAGGVMFFQWRQSRSGSEKFHSAMLPHAGTQTRTWREVVRLGAELTRLPEIAMTAADVRVALLFDWDNLWAVSNPDHPVELDYTDIVVRWYAAIHRQHVQVDIRKADHDLSAYDVVLAPVQYLLPAAAAANLAGYVRGGGHLLVAGFTDIVDEHDAFREGGFLTQLGPTLGIRLEDFGALPGRSRVSFRLDGSDHTGTTYAEEIEPAGATVLARFSTGRAEDRPAFTRHLAGVGAAYYLATLPDDHGMQAVTRHVFARAGVTGVLAAAHPDVEAIRAGEHLVVINHGEQARVVALGSGHVLDDVPVTELRLEPYGYTVVQGPLDPPARTTGAQPAGGTPVISMATRSAPPTARVRPSGATG